MWVFAPQNVIDVASALMLAIVAYAIKEPEKRGAESTGTSRNPEEKDQFIPTQIILPVECKDDEDDDSYMGSLGSVIITDDADYGGHEDERTTDSRRSMDDKFVSDQESVTSVRSKEELSWSGSE